MPPKKGKKKAADDDWEAEAFGETPDPIAAAEQDAKAAEDAKATAEEEAFAGGLMGALQRRGKKAKKNKQNNDFVEGEEPAPQNGEDKPEAKGAEEATAEDADDFWAAAEQDNKAKKSKQDNKAASPAGGDDEEEGGRVKSKKEKEREKKEREKQRKKEQAAKKKATAPAKKEEPAKPAPEAKKAEPTPAPAPVPEPAAASTAAGGKKKKLPAHLAALQKQQEELRKQREEEARLLAEEKARLEEEERKAAEEAKRKEEQKALKKQKEKERIAQLKKEGKYLTKAQKEAQARNELRMKQMLEAGGAKVAGLEEPADKPKKPVYERRKKGKKGPEEPKKEESPVEEVTEKVAELKVEEPPKPAEPEPEKKEEDDELDDWEAMADKEDGVPTADGVKDSWDAPTDEEDNAPAAKPAAANGKPAAASAKKAESSESESESDSDESSSEDEAVTAKQRADAARKAAAAERRAKQHEQALAARSKDDLRSPICCILGHVDTGKTKLLDKIRQTNVQEGEAGGITQQIGATYFPVEALKKKTAVVNQNNEFEFRVPGLLVIDTPGHESFTNLRSRGSSLCNMAILVIDIVHGLEPQTIESLNLLKAKKTPFIVALNKIDRLYGWRKIENNGVQDSLAFQSKAVLQEFKNRVDFVKVQLSEQGLNSELYYDNKNLARNVSLVPTSAITGEGVPDLLKLLVSLTQDRLTSSLMYLSEVEATVLEVKVVEGLGTTIDVILSNGILREGDRIVLCGNPEPIATNIRALLTPAEMKELRIKSQYVHNKEIKAAMGVKIAADGLDSAIAGSRLLVVGKDDDEEELMDDVMEDLQRLMGNISVNKVGVSVQASTLGSLEALLEFLRSEKIPVASVGIGPVFRRDIMPATIMLEKAKQYAMLLAFDVKVDKAAQEYADEMGVTIFTADIIYHLFDAFKAHQEKYKEQLKEEAKMNAVFPCELKTVAVFNKKDPIVVGVDVVRGTLKKLTPICTVKVDPTTKQRQVIRLGRVTSIERDHKEVPNCKAGQPSVAVKIEGPNQPLYGRQLEEDDPLYSEISRLSIDTLKEFYRDEVKNEEWKHIVDLKKLFDIS